MKTVPYTSHELSQMALQEISRNRARVIRHRQKHVSDADCKSTKADLWDPPRIIVACGALKSPYKAAHGRQNSTLKNGHPILKEAYESKGLRIGYPVPDNIKYTNG